MTAAVGKLGITEKQFKPDVAQTIFYPRSEVKKATAKISSAYEKRKRLKASLAPKQSFLVQYFFPIIVTY